MHALLHSCPHPAAGHRQPAPLPETPGHSQASLGQSVVRSPLLSPGSWCTQVLFEPSKRFWWVWGLILNRILPLLPSCWGFSFALTCGVSFVGGIQHSPVNGCSAVSCNFGVLTGGDECTAFYSTILWECYSNYFWEGVAISRNWATAHSLVFWQWPGTAMAPLGV